MSFLKKIRGDVRAYFVGLIMTGIIAILSPVGAAIWKAYSKEDIPWTIFIVVVCVGIALVVVAILLTNKFPVLTEEKLHELQTRNQQALSRPQATSLDQFDLNNAFEIDALAVPNLQNRTERGKPGWSLDCEVSVHNLHPTQGFDDVRLRILSITPSMIAIPSHHPKTQDTVLRRVQFAFTDIPTGRALFGDQTAHINLFRAEKYVQFSGTTVLLTFNGAWPDNLNNAFSPEGQYLMTVEVTARGVRTKTAQFAIAFSTEGDEPVFAVRKDGGSNGLSGTAAPALQQAHHNPLILALEELDAIHAEGDSKATLYQCKGAKLPTPAEAVAWNERAIASVKREIFAKHISTQDWATFKVDWNFASCQKMARVLHEHGFLDDINDTKSAHFKFLWGRVKRLGELIAKIKGLPADENKTPIESLTDFLLEAQSLLDVFANLARPLPYAEEHDLFEKIRHFLRKTAPEYVPRFNEIIEEPPTRVVDFPANFTDADKKEWSRTRSGPCDRLHAIAAYLSRIISDLRSKLPS
jgi:hypothetical protein